MQVHGPVRLHPHRHAALSGAAHHQRADGVGCRHRAGAVRVSVPARSGPAGDAPWSWCARTSTPTCTSPASCPLCTIRAPCTGREAVEMLRSSFGDLVFKTVIRKTIKFAEAPVQGQSVLKYAPDSEAAEAYRAACERGARMEKRSSMKDSGLRAPVQCDRGDEPSSRTGAGRARPGSPRREALQRVRAAGRTSPSDGRRSTRRPRSSSSPRAASPRSSGWWASAGRAPTPSTACSRPAWRAWSSSPSTPTPRRWPCARPTTSCASAGS